MSATTIQNGQTTVDTLLSRLARVTQRGAGQWLASCPTAAHPRGDRSRGLSIRETDDGVVLLHCFGGCSPADVVSAVGLDLGDLFPPHKVDYDQLKRRAPRIDWRAAFEGIEHRLNALSLAFLDLAAGAPFDAADAAYIASCARDLAERIGRIRHET